MRDARRCPIRGGKPVRQQERLLQGTARFRPHGAGTVNTKPGRFLRTPFKQFLEVKCFCERKIHIRQICYFLS